MCHSLLQFRTEAIASAMVEAIEANTTFTANVVEGRLTPDEADGALTLAKLELGYESLSENGAAFGPRRG